MPRRPPNKRPLVISSQEAQVRNGIKEGLADVKAGRVISDADLGRWADARFGKVRKAASKRK